MLTGNHIIQQTVPNIKNNIQCSCFIRVIACGAARRHSPPSGARQPGARPHIPQLQPDRVLLHRPARSSIVRTVRGVHESGWGAGGIAPVYD